MSQFGSAGFADALTKNPVVQTLAMESPYKYVYEIILFLYVYGCAESVIGSEKGVVFEFFLVNLRAFGSLYIVVPLVLGKLPGEFLQGFDVYFKFYLVGVALAYAIAKFKPELGYGRFRHVVSIASSIFLGNACAAAVDQGNRIVGGIAPPLILGYLGCVGDQFIELGMSTALKGVSGGWYTPTDCLSFFGPIIFTVLSQYGCPPVLGRVALVFLRLAAEFYELNIIIDFVAHIKATALSILPDANHDVRKVSSPRSPRRNSGKKNK